MAIARVSVRWAIERGGVDVRAFARLMRAAEASRLVDAWDDGRGRIPWYTARRGSDERVLRAQCVAALGCEPERVEL